MGLVQIMTESVSKILICRLPILSAQEKMVKIGYTLIYTSLSQGSLGRKPVPGANCPVGLFGAQSTTNCSSFREAQINPLRYRRPVPPTFSPSSSQLSFLAGPLSPRRSNAFWPESVARSSGFCSVSDPWKQSPDRGRHNLYDRPLPEHADRLKIGIGQRSQLN